MKTQPFVKRKPVKTEKNTGTITFRFRQVLLYLVCGLVVQNGRCSSAPSFLNKYLKDGASKFKVCQGDYAMASGLTCLRILLVQPSF
jgi:hypothetical protein